MLKEIEVGYIKKRSRSSVLMENLLVKLISALAGLLQWSPRVEDVRQSRTILVIRHNQLGDAVAASSFLQALKEVFPSAVVDVVASASNKNVFSWIPGVNEILVVPEGGIERFRFFWALRGKYDLVFQTLLDENYLRRTLQGRIAASHGRLVGRRRGSPLENLMDYPVYMPAGSYVGKLMSMIASLTDSNTAYFVGKYSKHVVDLPEEFSVSACRKLNAAGLAGRDFVALNISAREEFRQISTDQAVGLAKELLRSGVKVCMFYAPEDSIRASEIGMRAPGVVDCGFSSLAESMAALRFSMLYLGPDTGAAHFAAAAQKPCVVLFADKARPDVWSPYGVPCISIQPDFGGGVMDIPNFLVLSKVNELLSGIEKFEILRVMPRNFPPFSGSVFAPVPNVPAVRSPSANPRP
jgi:ADP-heptose:LPS heptosyltransferase